MKIERNIMSGPACGCWGNFPNLDGDTPDDDDADGDNDSSDDENGMLKMMMTMTKIYAKVWCLVASKCSDKYSSD